MTRMAIIDFEASCLPEDNFSYPIAATLADDRGNGRTWLIRPARQWRFWDWCERAEALHGISRERLARDGLPAAQVLAELADAAAGCRVYADADLDAYWLETLAAACGQPVPFAVRPLGELLARHGLVRAEITSAFFSARADARRLAAALRLPATPPKPALPRPARA